MDTNITRISSLSKANSLIKARRRSSRLSQGRQGSVRSGRNSNSFRLPIGLQEDSPGVWVKSENNGNTSTTVQLYKNKRANSTCRNSLSSSIIRRQNSLSTSRRSSFKAPPVSRLSRKSIQGSIAMPESHPDSSMGLLTSELHAQNKRVLTPRKRFRQTKHSDSLEEEGQNSKSNSNSNSNSQHEHTENEQEQDQEFYYEYLDPITGQPIETPFQDQLIDPHTGIPIEYFDYENMLKDHKIWIRVKTIFFLLACIFSSISLTMSILTYTPRYDGDELLTRLNARLNDKFSGLSNNDTNPIFDILHEINDKNIETLGAIELLKRQMSAAKAKFTRKLDKTEHRMKKLKKVVKVLDESIEKRNPSWVADQKVGLLGDLKVFSNENNMDGGNMTVISEDDRQELSKALKHHLSYLRVGVGSRSFVLVVKFFSIFYSMFSEIYKSSDDISND